MKEKPQGRRLVYLDTTATSLRPKQVVDAVVEFYHRYNANIHRGKYWLSEVASELYDEAHKAVARFLNAPDWREVIFTRNTTESINLVSYSLGKLLKLGPGDEIVTTVSEHHSNMVPWQVLAKETGATLKYIPVNPDGTLKLEEAAKLITSKTKIVAFQHVSNVTGVVHPVEELVELAKRVGAYTVVDGAQSAPHLPVDVQALGVDFYAISGHKMLGPTGIGALWGRRELLEEMPPFITGGDMISRVTLGGATWNALPWKFEAGTSNIAGGIGFKAAVEYLERLGMDRVLAHEREILEYAWERLKEVPKLTLYGPPPEKRLAILPFNIGGMHPHTVAKMLDRWGICVRSGCHCAQPLAEAMGVPEGTVRASFYIYNTKEDVDALVDALKEVAKRA